jgi:hypothetical protein
MNTFYTSGEVDMRKVNWVNMVPVNLFMVLHYDWNTKKKKKKNEKLHGEKMKKIS